MRNILCLLVILISFEMAYSVNMGTQKQAGRKSANYHFIEDTLAMDTVIIRYKAKRKDTALRLGRYRGGMPKFRSRIGSWHQDSMPADLMNKFIDSPLRIVSDNQQYRVIRYRFSYRKKDVYLDDQTMSVKIKYELISYYVYGSPLPDKHAKHIRGEVKGAEEFWFEEIMVANKNGEQFLAPDIHIKTYD